MKTITNFTLNTYAMLTPLKQFICDTCGQVIERPEDGWIEWISKSNGDSGARMNSGFRIVHHLLASPLKDTNERGCYTNRISKSTYHLHEFINEEHKMTLILGLLDDGPYHEPDYKGSHVEDIREYVEFVRRLTIPYYEEARTYWAQAIEEGYFGSANEIAIYGAGALQGLIEHYSNQ